MSTSSPSREFACCRDAPEARASALSEEESHREHRAALEATLFVSAGAEDELVFELEDGKLHLSGRLR